ncbi:Mitogen-activated protein kinase-binding protein 1 [Phytophthora cactorum]|nr:Mitogen-activated protein kinase-binding protein 1 [Phytophthora cactorum]KAG3104073.1 Mitogen-activated protein kinase-binding protein 1 [Phytophthora cactorum]KAG3206367.1 Mitogen-activated protein kinase-binding protein 1 [Phytophthora cactorum]
MTDAVLPPPRSRLILERVLGLTALSNAQVAVNPASGELAYAAGCIVVIYNLRRNKQVRYYRVDKSVSCLCFSPNGQFLAIGEKGYLPAITIWDGTDGTLCAELQRHQYGVACMAFSQDGRFLLSAGLVHDQHLYAWELKLKKKDAVQRLEVTALGCAFVEDKILGADYCQAGNFFVTVGEKHFKYWFLGDNGSFLSTGLRVNDLPELQYRDAVVNAKTSATFTGVGCGYGSCELKTFAVTLDGTLCCFGASGIMERLVSLESNCGNAISVTESYVAAGGSSGVVRLFNPSTLEYRATLPFPPAFGTANQPSKHTPGSPSVLYPADAFRYPAVIATRITGSHVIVFYSDRSIFIYGTTNTEAVALEHSFLYHSGGIRDLQVAGLVRGINAKGKLVYNDSGSAGGVSANIIPTGTFVTCSDDNTVRLWNLELHRRPAKSSRFKPSDDRSEHEYWKNPYSEEMLQVIYNDHDNFKDAHCVVLGGTCSHDSSTSVHSPPKGHGLNKGLRTVAIRLDQKEIAAGDQEGNVVVMPVPLEKPVIRIGAHSSKVNCLAYSSLNDDGAIFMASGGKDRLIQLYDCQRGHAVLSTLESHSAAVMAVSLSSDGKRLLSCGADNAVSVSGIDAKGKVIESKVLPLAEGKVFDTVLLPDSDTIVASCNNKLELFSASTGKQKLTHLVGEQHHVAVCPANYCVAMSGSLAERTIHVIDMKTGETLATGTGHSEAITAVKFTPDCRRLLSSSSDGCIFVWRLGDDIQTEIKARLPRVTEVPQLIPAPSHVTNADHQAIILPPPPPPVSGLNNLKKAELSGAPLVTEDVHSGHTPGSPEGDPAAPRRTPKRSPKWKGNGVAVPGPMAAIPMEKWMQTRTTAKPTIHVVDEAASTRRQDVSGNEIELTNHGEQTLASGFPVTPGKDAWKGNGIAVPGPMAAIPMETWMRTRMTAKPTIHVSDEAASLPSKVNVSRIDIEVSALSIQQTDHGETTLVGGLPVTPGKDELMNLSVKVLTTNANMSSSLALEREQLEKRKKQIDTANAVAAMNTRLSQLGLLKSVTKAASTQSKLTFPSPLKQQKDAESEAIKSPVSQVGNSTVSDCDVSSSKSSRVDKLTPSNSDAESLPAQETVHTNSDVNTDRSLKVAKSIVSSDDTDGSTPTQVNKSNGEDAGKFTDDLVSQALQKLNNDEPPHPFPVDVGVADSLSVHINGYGSHDKNNDDNCDAGKNQPNVLPQVEVDVSLSSFTSGFVASSEAAMEKVGLSGPVASSLSVFTTGYQTETKVSRSDALSFVKPNDPVAIVEDPQQVPVDVSLSTFTSGYDTVKENVTKRNIDTKEAVRPPTVASDTLESATSEILVNLCQPLDDAANSLGKMASGQEQINLNLLEIQNLIEALRSAIATTLKH